MKKFTLMELLVVIAIIGILTSMLLPSLRKAREAARLAVCISNFSQINKAALAYTLDNNDQYMPTDPPKAGVSWDDFLLDSYLDEITPDNKTSNYPEYSPMFEVFKCPSDYISAKQPASEASFYNGSVSYRRSYSLNGVSNGFNANVHSPKIFGNTGTHASQPYYYNEVDAPTDTIFGTKNPKHDNNVGHRSSDTVFSLSTLSRVDVYDKDINGSTYKWGVDKNIHGKAFRYPFCMIDGSVKVLKAEETRENANYLWLGKKP